MARKFNKAEIDLLYEQLKPDEEVLWKGKPRLIPNFTVITSLALFLVSALCFTILVFLNDSMELWFLYSLVLLDLGIIFYMLNYSVNYLNSINHLFYVITNSRLVIINTDQKKISLYKRFTTVRILRIKRTIFDTASIIFDVDFTNEKLREIGFINIDQADKVLKIINQQLSHMRTE